MTISTAIFLIFGLPLIIICIGILILVLKYSKSQTQREQISDTLALAQKLDQTLTKMETRLTVLEDILLGEDAPPRKP